MKRLLDFNPLTGESVIFNGHGDGSFSITHQQETTNVIEGNKRLALDTERTGKGIKKDWWHYARIPNIVAMKWRAELGVDIFNKNHKKRIFELLNSPEYEYLRVTHKRHTVHR